MERDWAKLGGDTDRATKGTPARKISLLITDRSFLTMITRP
jgi:hypothetical protein